jgi:hypothetical protein
MGVLKSGASLVKMVLGDAFALFYGSGPPAPDGINVLVGLDMTSIGSDQVVT